MVTASTPCSSATVIAAAAIWSRDRTGAGARSGRLGRIQMKSGRSLAGITGDCPPGFGLLADGANVCVRCTQAYDVLHHPGKDLPQERDPAMRTTPPPTLQTATVSSRDGTTIGYRRVGSGPGVI